MSKLETACPKRRKRPRRTARGGGLQRETSLARGGPISRGKPMKRGGKIKARRRSAEEMTRIYGTPARRTWMKAQPCVACVLVSPLFALADHWHCDIAHVETGGIGYKADADRTVPLCRKHHRWYDEHHDFLGKPEIRAAIKGAADNYEAAWQDHINRGTAP